MVYIHVSFTYKYKLETLRLAPIKALLELDSIDLGEVITMLADGFAVFFDFGEVAMSKDALEKKEVIDTMGKELFIIDPLFKQWLIHRYFGSK